MSDIFNASERTRLLERLGGLGPDAVGRWGSMSPHGMVCHLRDAFLLGLGERETEHSSTLLERTVIRFFALTLPVRWPKGVRSLAEVDQEREGTPPEVFDSDLASLRQVIGDFVERLDPNRMTHPVFGRLSRGEWGRWGYRHVDHHLRQFGL